MASPQLAPRSRPVDLYGAKIKPRMAASCGPEHRPGIVTGLTCALRLEAKQSVQAEIPTPLLRMKSHSARLGADLTAQRATPKRDPGARCRPRAKAQELRSAAALPRFGMALSAHPGLSPRPLVAFGSDQLGPLLPEGKNLTSIRTLNYISCSERRSAPESVRFGPKRLSEYFPKHVSDFAEIRTMILVCY